MEFLVAKDDLELLPDPSAFTFQMLAVLVCTLIPFSPHFLLFEWLYFNVRMKSHSLSHLAFYLQRIVHFKNTLKLGWS